MIEYRGEKFSGYNKAKRTPGAKKSHAVLAKEGGKVKLIRFGQQGVSGSPKKKGESEAAKKRRASFKARHSANIKKGKMSAAFWSNKIKW
jgi:phage gp16-like protein